MKEERDRESTEAERRRDKQTDINRHTDRETQVVMELHTDS